MKPYYVLVTVGALDENGNPQKFGLVAADGPEQAEEEALKLAKIHAAEPCSIAVFQLFRNYPGTLLREMEVRRREALEIRSAYQDILNGSEKLRAANADLKEQNRRLLGDVLSFTAKKAAKNTAKEVNKSKKKKKKGGSR